MVIVGDTISTEVAIETVGIEVTLEVSRGVGGNGEDNLWDAVLWTFRR